MPVLTLSRNRSLFAENIPRGTFRGRAQSALALQVNWPDVVKDLTGRLMRAGSAEQQNQAARVLLEFMKVRRFLVFTRPGLGVGGW